MGKLFGTDGIRGVVGKTLHPELTFRVGQAVATVLHNKLGRKAVITIGKDTRISSDMLESALCAGICSVGGDALLLGTIPTPAVAYLTIQEKADAGIVISASHNPYEHNGIKVFNAQGYKLPDQMEAEIEDMVLSDGEIGEVCGADLGRRINGAERLREDYIEHLLATVTSSVEGLRVLVDCANGAASATAPDLFARLPLTADFISTTPNGININHGCGSTHLEPLSAAVVAGAYDLGIAFDGDADRCLFVDEQGKTIDGDKVMAVCALMLRKRNQLCHQTIVATVMSNLGLHEFCRTEGLHLVCTDVGDRNVLEKMIECDYAIGGEQSGHTIFRAYATTGDGELTALQFLQAYKEAGIPASEFVRCCEQYPQVLLNVPVSSAREKERIMSSALLWQAVKCKEAAFGSEGRILVRPSGTEALIRVMVEAKTDFLALSVASELVDTIKKL